MEEKKYMPKPIDTSSVELPEELKVLAEKLAKNVHEVSEEEKDYDRNTSVETIKLILKLGFNITRDGE